MLIYRKKNRARFIILFSIGVVFAMAVSEAVCVTSKMDAVVAVVNADIRVVENVDIDLVSVVLKILLVVDRVVENVDVDLVSVVLKILLVVDSFAHVGTHRGTVPQLEHNSFTQLDPDKHSKVSEQGV